MLNSQFSDASFGNTSPDQNHQLDPDWSSISPPFGSNCNTVPLSGQGNFDHGHLVQNLNHPSTIPWSYGTTTDEQLIPHLSHPSTIPWSYSTTAYGIDSLSQSVSQAPPFQLDCSISSRSTMNDHSDDDSYDNSQPVASPQYCRYQSRPKLEVDSNWDGFYQQPTVPLDHRFTIPFHQSEFGPQSPSPLLDSGAHPPFQDHEPSHDLGVGHQFQHQLQDHFQDQFQDQFQDHFQDQLEDDHKDDHKDQQNNEQAAPGLPSATIFYHQRTSTSSTLQTDLADVYSRGRNLISALKNESCAEKLKARLWDRFLDSYLAITQSHLFDSSEELDHNDHESREGCANGLIIPLSATETAKWFGLPKEDTVNALISRIMVELPVPFASNERPSFQLPKVDTRLKYLLRVTHHNLHGFTESEVSCIRRAFDSEKRQGWGARSSVHEVLANRWRSKKNDLSAVQMDAINQWLYCRLPWKGPSGNISCNSPPSVFLNMRRVPEHYGRLEPEWEADTIHHPVLEGSIDGYVLSASFVYVSIVEDCIGEY